MGSCNISLASLPTRERGLKSLPESPRIKTDMVAPYTGAWIEIRYIRSAGRRARVAPYTGAWIEIAKESSCNSSFNTVAPYTGAWIEIPV
ncbi:hypothetical protein [Caproicibacterium sp. XB2]|uniref:hypothetical protein n=1 Tax=Caproicibacterium sp. XB2 TaxID=3388458 RepID=UPI003850AB98